MTDIIRFFLKLYIYEILKAKIFIFVFILNKDLILA